MPFNPGGVFSLVASYFAQAGATIRTEQHNPVFEDVASALSLVLIRDGRAPMTGPLNMNGNQITNIAQGSSPNSVATLAQAMPIGAVIDYAGGTAPSGWMLCYGQAVSRTTYAALLAVIGTTYGAGDGSTTFNLPDCRGCVVAGRDTMGGAAANRLTGGAPGVNGAVLGASGGEQTATAPLVSHTHNGTTGVDSNDHTHSGVIVGNTTSTTGGGAFSIVGTLISGSTNPQNLKHVHSFTTDSAGPGGTHNNVQPTIIMNKIIRASYNG